MNEQVESVIDNPLAIEPSSKLETAKGLLSVELSRYPSQAAAITAWFAKGGKIATVKPLSKSKNTFKILADESSADDEAYEMKLASNGSSSSSSSEGMRRAEGVIENHPWFLGYQHQLDKNSVSSSKANSLKESFNHPLYEPFNFDDELGGAYFSP